MAKKEWGDWWEGPWRFDETSGKGLLRVYQGGGGANIREVATPIATVTRIGMRSGAYDEKRCKATLRLITASPELYEAVSDLLDQIALGNIAFSPNNKEASNAVIFARGAMMKARGQLK